MTIFKFQYALCRTNGVTNQRSIDYQLIKTNYLKQKSAINLL